ncbi:MAG: exosortase family protein XrtG [Lachnospiraceae bacterium]|nr:exosortase family protein XrtG [Lachnospiraceae bacterium]
MSNKVALYLLLLVIWIYALSVLKRTKLTAFHFMVGSGGMFTFLFVAGKRVFTEFCARLLMFMLEQLGHIFTFYTVYSKYYVLFINNKDANISMLIDYECCGIIEILVVISVVCFFPLFSIKERVLYSLIGFFYTTVANIIRLLIISFIIYINGNDSYYIAHSFIGRIVFYILTVLLYFYIISRNQIKNQKVGNFDYE